MTIHLQKVINHRSKSEYTDAKPEVIKAEIDENSIYPEDEFYTLEEFEQLEDNSMAYMSARFKHIKFGKNPRYKKSSRSKFQDNNGYSGSRSGSRSNGSFKLNMIDKSKTRCYNCNDLGHFATEWRKPKTAPAKEQFTSYEKKNSYLEFEERE